MEYIISTENLTKKYKDTTALFDVSIHIPKASIYGLIGNNGAGKTTLMKVILGLQTPTSGIVKKDNDIPTGAILDHPSLFPLWSAKRNLNYQLSLIKNPEFCANELLDIVNLKDTKKPVIQYSYGMKQRLALALALANKPKLVFLDEPLNGLDPQGIRDIRSLIRKLCDEGTTIIISSHILDELQKIVTHVGLLQNGHLIKECEIEKISDTSLENYYFNEFEGENK